MTTDRSSHAVLVLRDNRVIFASARAAEMIACSIDELKSQDLDQLLRLFSPSDAKRISRVIRRIEDGELIEPTTDLCLQNRENGCTWIDLILSRGFFEDEPAIQMVWIEKKPLEINIDSIRQDVWRFQALHELDRALLLARNETETATLALKQFEKLVPDFHSGSVYRLDHSTGRSERLASYPLSGEPLPRDYHLEWAEMIASIPGLAEGLPYIFSDLESQPASARFSQELLKDGSHAGLILPLRWDGKLQGTLDIYSDSQSAFSVERIQLSQEISNLLAAALHQTEQRASERQAHREAEAMRDVMVSLAGAADLNQTLQAILVNLHNVIEYDKASLYLVDESERYIVTEKAVSEQKSTGRAFHEHNPLVDQMRRTGRPVIIADIQGDDRFADWPDVETVRGWLGAPLSLGEEMIGFLSLGSLKTGFFNQEHAERLQVFANQVAVVLERAWLSDQNQRRAEELEVLSSVTLALGKAEGGENTLDAVLKEIAHFSGAQNGVFLFPDRLESTLVVKASLDESTLGLSFPSRWDPLWDVYVRGETSLVQDLQALQAEQITEDYLRIFPNAQSAVLVPVKTGGSAFGVLGFGFDSFHKVTEDSVRMCSSVAEIAAASLRRAVILESLEKQIDVRTQHLSTLYDINAIASEPLELQDVLEQIMRITLESMTGQAGCIHFLNEKDDSFHLAIGHGISPEIEAGLQSFSASQGFWSRLANSSSPVVINDTASELSLPPVFDTLYGHGQRAFIGAPIRAKGQLLGLLSLFDRSILDYTIEDITLFMTIADQIGSMVERARLMKQAEIAAVVQERQRLARELHDSVTQLLYSQVLFAGAGLKVLHQGEQQTTQDYLERINQAALQALKEMRLLVYQLRPSDYLDEGLIGALTRRLDSVEKRTGINARLMVEGQLGLDEAMEMVLYRIAEEALNNTLKHAHATAVTITLRGIDSRVILEVADNGVGFDPQDNTQRGQREAGMGIENMRERTAALGGRIEIHSQPGQGTRVLVEIEVPV